MSLLLTNILIGVYFISFFFVVFWLITFLTEPEHLKKRRLTEYPLVTIGIPAYNEEKNIEKTLYSVIQLDYPKEKMEIIIVNDGSKDTTQQKAEKIIKQYPEYQIELINQKNQGKGAALNTAIKKAKGEFFVCLDADSYPQKNALKKIIPCFEDNKDIAVVLPCMKTVTGKNFLQKIQRYEYIINMFYKELMGKLDCIRVTPGPFSVYRTKVFEKIGGFDENNLTEDLEMAIRLQKNNYKIVQTTDSTVYTVPPNTFKQLLKQRNRWYKGSILNSLKYKKLIFQKKYGDFGIMEMPASFFSGIIVLTIITSMIYSFLKPIIQNIHNFSLIGFDFSAIFNSYYTWFTRFNILDLNFVLISLSICMGFTSFYF